MNKLGLRLVVMVAGGSKPPVPATATGCVGRYETRC